MSVHAIISFLLIFSLLSGCAGTLFFWVYTPTEQIDSFALLFNAISGLSNMLIAFVAYWQLPALERTSQADHEQTKATFFLHLTEKWMHEDLIQARCILHHQALMAVRKTSIPQAMSAHIIALSKDTHPEAIRQFSQIISLLEFMETLSGFYRSGYASLVLIRRLFGGSVERYYFYLQGYINFRRSNGSPPGLTFKSDESLYKNFEDLVHDLRVANNTKTASIHKDVQVAL